MRLTFAAVAWLGLAVAATFLVHSEKQLHERRVAARAFDVRAREAAAALSDLRGAQEAYVAAGQGIGYWIPKVTSTMETASRAITALSESATAAPAKEAAADASKTLSDFASVDKRAREYLKSDEQLMAADVIFTEGGQTLAAAGQQVETARLAEREALDAAEADARKLEAAAAGGAAAFAGLLLVLFAARPKMVRVPEPAPAPAPVASAAPLKTAAGVCTDLARVREAADLNALLRRAADVLGAKGLIVWLGSADGQDLRAVLAHGYPQQRIARMPAVPRSADNAAARAYRTGEVQVFAGGPGTTDAAVVTPLLSADGCVGALSLEMASGAEPSEQVQSLAAIFAAQLAAIVGGAQAAESSAQAAPSAKRA
jgi:hypothetical protein